MKNSPYSYEQCLENFFSEVTPADLKRSILYIYLNYLIYMDKKSIPKDFSMIAEDVLLIIGLLDEIDGIRNNKCMKKMREAENE